MELPDFLNRDRGGLILLVGHRIGLHDVLHFYQEGYSPEMIAGELPTLTLAVVHKTIAFYLENQDEVDAWLEKERSEVARQRREAKRGPSVTELRKRMQAMHEAEVP